MLLGRVIGHVKEQNWTAIAIDFVTVVAGILIAFQITEWNEARRERIREREYAETVWFRGVLAREGLAGALPAARRRRLRVQPGGGQELTIGLIAEHRSREIASVAGPR